MAGALCALVLLGGCSVAHELLRPPDSPRMGLVVQNPACVLICFGSVSESLRDTDITESPNNPYSRSRVVPDLFYP